MIKYGSNYVRVHPCRITLDRNSSLKPREEPTIEETSSHSNRQYDNYPFGIQTCHGNNEPESDSNDQSASLPLLETDDSELQNENIVQTRTVPVDTRTEELLKKNKTCFKYHNDDSWYTAKLVTRGGKSTGKYANTWNAEFLDGNIKAVDFDREVSTWVDKDINNRMLENTNLCDPNVLAVKTNTHSPDEGYVN